MVKKHCCKCGNEFLAPTVRHRICPDCKEKARKEHIEYTKSYRKTTRHTVLVENDDYNVLQAIAEVTGMSITKVIHEIIQQKVLDK